MNDLQRLLESASPHNDALADPMKPGDRGIARPPMHVEVRSKVRDIIVEGRLRAGEHINETDLAAFLKVSRTPLREALKELQNEGLVQHEPNKGFSVTHITVQHTAELFESLACIERFCGEIATAKITEDQLHRFSALHQEMFGFREKDDRSRYFAINERIHRAYVLLSGNSMLARIHSQLLIGAKRIRYTAIRFDERWNESIEEHRAILAAMNARKAIEVGRLIENHVRETGEFVCAHLREIEPEQPRRRRAGIYDRRL